MLAFYHRSHDRRGVLLLLVLSLLTLFMMLGAIMMVLATRARTTARAFANATSVTAVPAIQSQAVLDEALMILLRGSKGALPPQFTENLLEDRYGDATTGEAVAGSVSALTSCSPTLEAGPILTASIQNLWPPVTHPCELNGRVLTFKPETGDGDIASYRILRAAGATAPFTVYLANSPVGRIITLPKNKCSVVINGREFLNEAHDSHDQDAWLARVELTDSRVSAVPQASYGGASPNLECDNDNDGIADGVWISGLIPDRPSPLGGTLRYQISYHVLDLDGRINLNAHGAPTAVTTGSADWVPTSNGTNIANVPVGMGYGPADVDVSRLLSDSTDANAAVPGFQSRRLINLMVSGTAAPQQATATIDQRRPTPQLGSPIEGRYGRVVSGSVIPGAAGASHNPITICGLRGNAPTDLHVRTKVFLKSNASGVPTLTYYTPDRAALLSMGEFAGDPYQLRLDLDGPRIAVLRQPAAKAATPPADNPYTVSELERVLRQFDSDASNLPPRLAAALDDLAEKSRTTITTDSWDTPSLSGTAMARILDYMRLFPAPTSPLASGASVYGAISPDVSAGLRFDVNRPLDHPTVPVSREPELKERYCRHLYTLLCALDPKHGQSTAAVKAQWAANVCDFRDMDSTMTKFAFDSNPLDGWSPDPANASNPVFGVERPEVVITETIAWTGQLMAVLHHPWNAVVIDKTGTTTATEVMHPSLAVGTAGADANVLQLAKKHGGGSGSSVWRMRLDGSPTAVLDFGTADPTACRLAADGTLCVQTSAALPHSLTQVTAPSLAPAGAGNPQLVLERLADPTKANDETPTSSSYNPYITVDEATLTVYADKTSAIMKKRSPISFWKQEFLDDTNRPPAAYSSGAPWFHWPNRPFVSAAELALVPTGNASGVLANYKQPDASNPFSSLATLPALGVLDAVYVPSRFAGNAQSIGLRADGSNPFLVFTATTEMVCTTQLPRWREPGRVNVNTISANTGNTSNSQLDNAVWKAVAGVAAPANPFNTAVPGVAADSFTKLISVDAAPGKPPFAESPATPRHADPFFSYATAIRLANVGTIRSHVFAVWITLKTTDTSANAPSPTTHRLFAIVDRSIPVGYSKGENLNVRDAVRLERILE